jgi:cobalt-zinc-cadmium efflux system membrane fusion protein
MRNSLLLTTLIFLAMLLYAGCNGSKQQDHADESGHDHSEELHNAHADEEAGEHDNEDEIALSPEVMKMAGITTARVETGKISRSLDLSGEIGFNEDGLVHITPRFPGIIKEARYKIGEYVKAGETVAVIESNESMTTYSLKAPLSGRIIEKHATAGEHMTEEESLYLLADLSAVWANLAVYPKDADRVKQGQKVSIVAVGSESSTTGTISYVTPVMDAQTRKINARVVLPNGNNIWRPGTFVNASIVIGEGEPGLVVDRGAVQILDNKSIVFIQHEPGVFKLVPVTTGEKNSVSVMILAGLEEGQQYVNNGAFELKAKIVTSSMGAHAGHNH